MTDLIRNYIAVNTICSVALIVMAYMSWNNVLLDYKTKRQYSLSALIVVMVLMAEIGTVVSENIPLTDCIPALIANTVGFSLSPIVGIVLSKAIYIENGKIRLYLSIPVWINFVLALSSPWTGMIFQIDSDSGYLRGPLFGLYVIAYVCSYAILLIGTINSMKHYQYRTKSTFILLFCFTVLGTTVQLVFPHVHITWLCITLSLILFYAYFCSLTQTQDILTGVLNRNVYDQYINRLDRDTIGFAVIFDLDDFKQVNDVYGHQWGDFCLRMIGRMIRGSFQKMGLCYRIGGDEFCVICENTDEQQVKEALREFHRIIDMARENENLQGKFPMVSTGYAIFSDSTMEYAIALRKADEQMYSVKKNRKRSEHNNTLRRARQ